MSRIERFTETLSEVLRSWGIETRVAAPARQRAKVRVQLPIDGNTVEVGVLTNEDGEFVFRYDAAFRDSHYPAIAAFPDKDREYRQRELWPFFEVRLPPLKRLDVQLLIATRHLGEADTLRLLGELGHKTITTPYELQYSAA